MYFVPKFTIITGIEDQPAVRVDAGVGGYLRTTELEGRPLALSKKLVVRARSGYREAIKLGSCDDFVARDAFSKLNHPPTVNASASNPTNVRFLLLLFICLPLRKKRSRERRHRHRAPLAVTCLLSLATNMPKKD